MLSDEEIAEIVKLRNDPEFLRLKAMYMLAHGTNDIWQLIPNSTDDMDRVVTLGADPFVESDPGFAA
jgi:hypothetical protein